MSYSTVEDLKELIPEEMLIQLTDDESTGSIALSRVTEAIAQADAEINSYCASKYAVPFLNVPETVKKCSVDLAIYNLYSRRVERMPETRTDRYRNAVRLLEGIARGTVSIGVDPEPKASGGGDRIESSKAVDDRTVTAAKIGGY